MFVWRSLKGMCLPNVMRLVEGVGGDDREQKKIVVLFCSISPVTTE